MSETLLFIVQELNACRRDWPKVERESGVSQKTFEKIAYGYTRNPRLETVERLRVYFERKRKAA